MQVIEQLMQGGGISGVGDAIQTAAKKIRCELAVLQAIIMTESGGSAYDNSGRLIILPEKHIFWRYLPKPLRTSARREGLATPKWSRKNYKGLGGKGSDRRWDRLRAMVNLDEKAALKSASYGKAQIMGFNHKICGYRDVTSFVLALAENEDNQDDAFINYLVGVGLAEDLRQRDFRAIARRYNGSGQVTYYAGLMERAYKGITGKTAKIKSAVRVHSLRLGSEGYQVKALQEQLCKLGYHTGIDGDFGPATRRSVVAFQAEHGLTANGIVDLTTKHTLEKAVPIMQSGLDGRQDVTDADLVARSQTARKADNLKKAAVGAGSVAASMGGLGELDGLQTGFGFIDTIIDTVGQFRHMISPIAGFVSDHPLICVVLAAGVVWYFSDGIFKRRMFDFKNWRHVG